MTSSIGPKNDTPEDVQIQNFDFDVYKTADIL
jgi:hypothetical protein